MSESMPSDATGRPDEIRDPAAFMGGLVFGSETVPAPPAPDVDHPVMVVRSLRLPTDLDGRLRAAGDARGVSVSRLVREWIELELTALEDDRPISRADALRALAALRPLDGAA